MLELLAALLILVLAASLVRRLLGIDRGRWGVTILAVVLAETCAVLVLRISVGNVRDLPPRAAFGAYALVTVFAMLVIVLVELLARPRGRRHALHIPHPIQGTRRLGGRAVRYVKVSAIALRHGLFRSGDDDLEVGGSRLGYTLSLMFEDAGGLFVKLDQAMAAQPHLVTRSVAAELARAAGPGGSCRRRRGARRHPRGARAARGHLHGALLRTHRRRLDRPDVCRALEERARGGREGPAPRRS